MTRYLLDTNILGNSLKPQPSPTLTEWITRQRDADLFIASLTVGEVRKGILQLPAGRRRASLETWFAGPEGPPALFAGRILAFDEQAAGIWAELMASGFRSGRPRSSLDTIIASVALANDCVVATENEKDFEGIATLNPMRAS